MNLQSKVTKALIIIVLLLTGMMAYAAANGQLTGAPQQIVGALAVPFQRLTSSVSAKLDAWSDRTLNIDTIISENEELKEELNELRKKQIQYDKIVMENRQYKDLLGIVEDTQKYETTSASVIGRDGLDKFYSFTIDKGEKNGIEKNDVVISADGVVGVVIETGANFAKVSTILSPAVSVGCFAGEERDNGIVCGDYDLSEEENCIMQYLPKTTKVKKGDIVSTTGLGTIFPKDLIVGTVKEIVADESGNSKSAVVVPAADITNVKMVFVITSVTY